MNEHHHCLKSKSLLNKKKTATVKNRKLKMTSITIRAQEIDRFKEMTIGYEQKNKIHNAAPNHLLYSFTVLSRPVESHASTLSNSSIFASTDACKNLLATTNGANLRAQELRLCNTTPTTHNWLPSITAYLFLF